MRWASEEHQTTKERLDRNAAILAATKKLLAAWHEQHDVELKALRDLDQMIDPTGHRRFHTVNEGVRTSVVEAALSVKV